MMKSVTDRHAFSAWEVDPSLGVCGECGRDRDNDLHMIDGAPGIDLTRDPRYKPYVKAIWDWTLSNGAPRSQYGSRMDVGATAALIHLNYCPIDHSQSRPPVVDTLSEFNGTDAPPREVTVSIASIACKCGSINRLSWVIDGEMSLNEIVFAVVTAGDTTNTPDGPGGRPDKYVKWIEKWVNEAGTTRADKRDLMESVLPTVLDAVYRSLDSRWQTPESLSERAWDHAIMLLRSGGYADKSYAATPREVADSVRVLMRSPMEHPGENASWSEQCAHNRRYGWSDF